VADRLHLRRLTRAYRGHVCLGGPCEVIGVSSARCKVGEGPSVSIALANSQLESRMMATVYRGDRVDPDQMLDSLEALVRARETAKSARDDD
jgi:hypothetical protein